MDDIILGTLETLSKLNDLFFLNVQLLITDYTAHKTLNTDCDWQTAHGSTFVNQQKKYINITKSSEKQLRLSKEGQRLERIGKVASVYLGFDKSQSYDLLHVSTLWMKACRCQILKACCITRQQSDIISLVHICVTSISPSYNVTWCHDVKRKQMSFLHFQKLILHCNSDLERTCNIKKTPEYLNQNFFKSHQSSPCARVLYC